METAIPPITDILPTVTDPRFEGVRSKLHRAEEHLIALEREILAFVEGKPYGHRMNLDLDTGEYAVTVHIKRHPGIHLSAILGDAIHNLRSALDHVANIVVGGPRRSAQFPIYSDADDFDCRVRVPAVKGRNGPLTGLAVESKTWTLIEECQPYNGDPSNHRLAILASFSNADKHRTLLPVGVAHGQPEWLGIEGTDFELIDSKFTMKVDGVFNDGDEFMSGRVRITGPNPAPQIHGDLPLHVAFREGMRDGEFSYTPREFGEIRNNIHGLIAKIAAGMSG